MVFDQTVGVNRFFLDMDSEDLWSYPHSDLIRNVLREPLYTSREHIFATATQTIISPQE